MSSSVLHSRVVVRPWGMTLVLLYSALTDDSSISRDLFSMGFHHIRIVSVDWSYVVHDRLDSGSHVAPNPLSSNLSFSNHQFSNHRFSPI